MPLGISPTVDFAFKKIFGSPENAEALIGLLNAILDLNQPITYVEILNPFNYQEFAEAKQIILDLKARDDAGRCLNIEMQVSIDPGLLQRMAYYACCLYVDQLSIGEPYAKLNPALSICLLNQPLFSQSSQSHHRFQMVDIGSGRRLPDAIEVHTVELTKYNLQEATVGQASPIEQWAFFLLRAHQYEAERLRELLPAVEFRRAITVIETIAAKTEDKIMYDQREKALRDFQWAIESTREDALKEGEKVGEEKGIEKGTLAGKIQLLQEMLGDSVESTSDLSQHSVEQLTSLLSSLQERLRTRGG